MTPIILASTGDSDQPSDMSGGSPAIPEHLLGGSAANFHFGVTGIEICGEPVAIPRAGVIALVGSNNVGKSTLLRQIHQRIARDIQSEPAVLTALEVDTSANTNDLIAWMNDNSRLVFREGRGPEFQRMGTSVGVQAAANAWTQRPLLNQLTPFLTHFTNAQNRTAYVNPAAARDDFTSPPTHPVHALEDDDEIFNELVRIAGQAFGTPLVRDRISGQRMLRVGTLGIDESTVHPFSKLYKDALGRLRPLHEQGDGMTSMLGILLPIVASTFPVILIDEPEAYLHPPQAYILGETIARLARDRSLQVFISTHDRSLLAGLTRDPSSSVTLIRMSRDEDVTRVRELPPENVRRISEDPSLRHTTILDGLFSKLVVLCENERDCQFYASAIDELCAKATVQDFSAHDILFVSCGGKQAIPRFAGLLADSGVPIVSTVDIDGLRETNDLKRIVEAVGKVWPTTLDTDISRATASLRAQPSPRKNSEVLRMISLVLKADPDSWYAGDHRERVREQLAIPNAWNQAQKYGIASLDSDVAARDRAFDALDELGVVIAKVGVLERFGPDLPQDKAKFVPVALSAGAHRSDAAQDHVKRILRAGRLVLP